jgi:hypothetical protein
LETAILCLAAFLSAHSSDQLFDRALETATPSSPGFAGGEHIHRYTCRGCKKSARIKLSVYNTFGDKTLLIIQTNLIIKAVKDDKMPK